MIINNFVYSKINILTESEMLNPLTYNYRKDYPLYSTDGTFMVNIEQFETETLKEDFHPDASLTKSVPFKIAQVRITERKNFILTDDGLIRPFDDSLSRSGFVRYLFDITGIINNDPLDIPFAVKSFEVFTYSEKDKEQGFGFIGTYFIIQSVNDELHWFSHISLFGDRGSKVGEINTPIVSMGIYAHKFQCPKVLEYSVRNQRWNTIVRDHDNRLLFIDFDVEKQYSSRFTNRNHHVTEPSPGLEIMDFDATESIKYGKILVIGMDGFLYGINSLQSGGFLEAIRRHPGAKGDVEQMEDVVFELDGNSLCRMYKFPSYSNIIKLASSRDYTVFLSMSNGEFHLTCKSLKKPRRVINYVRRFEITDSQLHLEEIVDIRRMITPLTKISNIFFIETRRELFVLKIQSLQDPQTPYRLIKFETELLSLQYDRYRGSKTKSARY